MSTFDKIAKHIDPYIKPFAISVIIFFVLANTIGRTRDPDMSRNEFFLILIEAAAYGAGIGVALLFIVGWVLFLPTLFLCWVYDKMKGDE